MGSRTGKRRVEAALKVAKTIEHLPAAQLRPGTLEVCDVANRTDVDHRDAISLKRLETVRRLTRVQMLVKASVISNEQAAACEWYHGRHELGFQTIGCTANYAGAGGGGFGSTDLLARYKAQSEAREDYFFARSAIPQHLIETFEGIVLGTGRPPHMMPKTDKIRFSLAAFLLHQQIGHMLLVAA